MNAQFKKGVLEMCVLSLLAQGDKSVSYTHLDVYKRQVMSLIRQVIATGLINFTNPFTNQLIFEVRLIPESFTISMFGSPTGAFLTFAVLAAALTAYKNAQAAKAAKKEAK